MDNSYYLPLKYLWIIILLPKPVQLGIFTLLLMYMFIKSHYVLHLNTVSKFLLMYLTVQLIAIIANSPGQSMVRVFAAVNTLLIWVIGVLLYGFYTKAKLNPSLIGKYCTWNLIILTLMGFAMLLNVNLPGVLGRGLMAIDWENAVQGLRLDAYMDYPNLILIFYLVQFPFAVYFVKSRWRVFTASLSVVLSAVPALLAHSRAGSLLVYLCVAFAISYILGFTKKQIISAIFLGLAISVLALLVFNDAFSSAIQHLLNARAGSTSMRQDIYTKSIMMTIHKSPIIGNGIKVEYLGYPLGSHSTYIGFLYKSGILGAFFAGTGFVFLILHFLKSALIGNTSIFFVVCFVSLLSFLALEDIDGSDWSLIIFWISAAIGPHLNRLSEVVEDRTGQFNSKGEIVFDE